MRRTLIASALAAALLIPFVLAPTVASADLGGVDEEELAAIEAINEVRVGLGLAPLRLSPILTEAAEWMAQDLADRDTIDHTDSLSRSMGDRVRSFNYPTNAYIRENLVVGTNVDTGTEAVDLWQNSAGHKANNEASDVSVATRRRGEGPVHHGRWTLGDLRHRQPGIRERQLRRSVPGRCGARGHCAPRLEVGASRERASRGRPHRGAGPAATRRCP